MTKQQRLVLAVAILASFVAFLDGAIVNVALPAIKHALGGGLAAQQWIVDAYLLTLGSFMLIAGSLSDLFGRRKIMALGLASFGVASLLCALAPSSGALVAFRALQGLGGALLVPSSLAMIISSFSGSLQGKAIGTWTAWTGIAFIIGPLAGGLLVDYASWRWIFAINVLPVAVTLYLLRLVESPRQNRPRPYVDLKGAVLCVLGLGGPVFALIEQSRYGWHSPLIYVPLFAGILVFAAFLVYERRAAHAMLPLSLFNHRNFSVGNAATLAIYAGLTASTFLIVVYLQQVAGYSALEAGLALLPVTVIMFVLSPRTGLLAGKQGPRLFMSLGPAVAGVGFLLLLNLQAQVDYWRDVLPAVVVFGIGLSITVAPLTAAILGDVPPQQAGIASAVNNAIARVAGLLAVAAVGAIVAAQFSTVLTQQASWYYSPQEITALSQTPLATKPPSSWGQNQTDARLVTRASVSAFHAGMAAVSALLITGAAISLIGIKNPSPELKPLKA